MGFPPQQGYYELGKIYLEINGVNVGSFNSLGPAYLRDQYGYWIEGNEYPMSDKLVRLYLNTPYCEATSGVEVLGDVE